MALRAKIPMVHQPIVRLWIEQALEGDVGGDKRRRACQEDTTECCHDASKFLHRRLPWLTARTRTAWSCASTSSSSRANWRVYRPGYASGRWQWQYIACH